MPTILKSPTHVVARNDAMDWDGRGAHKQQLEDLANLRAKKEAGASDDVALAPPFAVGSNVEALRGGYFGSSRYREEWCPAKVMGVSGDGISKFNFHIAYDNDEDGQPYTDDDGRWRHCFDAKPDKLRRVGAAPAHSAEARACSRRGAVSSRRGQQARLAGRVAGTGCATPSLLRHRRASPKSRMWQRHLFTAGGVKAAAVHTPRAAASEEAGHMAAPRPTQKLDGLMSRCTQPISCIVRMASTICTPALATVRSESRRRGADFRS